jgi:WD40 repeat protein
VFSFNGSTLTQLGVALASGLNAIYLAFSPDGKYLACQGYTGNCYIQLYSFTPSAATPLVQLGSNINVGTVASWLMISWSPDGRYLVVPYLDNIAVYRFYPEGIATLVTSAPFAGVVSTKFSPCGRYIAAGDNTGILKIFIFDGSTLAAPAQATGTSANFLLALAWSPDGKYVVTGGGNNASSNAVKVFQFSGTALAQIGADQTAANRVDEIRWSADGKYIALAEASGYTRVYSAMYGPTNCLIDNCRVCNTAATNQNQGRGLVGGGLNIFSRTLAVNNGINYSFGIPNVYDGRFEILRNVVQPFDNISMPTTL